MIQGGSNAAWRVRRGRQCGSALSAAQRGRAAGRATGGGRLVIWWQGWQRLWVLAQLGPSLTLWSLIQQAATVDRSSSSVTVGGCWRRWVPSRVCDWLARLLTFLGLSDSLVPFYFRYFSVCCANVHGGLQQAPPLLGSRMGPQSGRYVVCRQAGWSPNRGRRCTQLSLHYCPRHCCCRVPWPGCVSSRAGRSEVAQAGTGVCAPVCMVRVEVRCWARRCND